ncbi:hypothetical protein ACHWQZ_G001283 [Mnemiopsis leidyi]
MTVKPLNILIYCCKNNSVFENVSKILMSCVGKERYTVYQLDESEPWQRHCALVVIASHPMDISHKVTAQMKQYRRDGGKLISMGGYFSSLLPLDCFKEPPGPCLDDLCQTPSQLEVGQGIQKSLLLLPSNSFTDKTILTKALMEVGIDSKTGNTVQLQPLNVYCQNSTTLDNYFSCLKLACPVGDDGDLLYPKEKLQSDCDVKIFQGSGKAEFFDEHTIIGFPEVFIQSKAVTSTQDLLWTNSILRQDVSSVAVLADVQVAGKGRGKNQWISPLGSMCLSFFYTPKPGTMLTKKLPFVQYITALATIKAIQGTNSKVPPLRIKWPNDIYTGDGKKIGGVLVNCSSNGKTTQLCIGIGINVNNDEPTISLAKLSGSQTSVPKLASKVCCSFIEEVDLFNELGYEQFIERFCQSWLHQDKLVKISVGSVNCDAIIKSIDADGYLSVVDLASNKSVSVQPDGNSFDMMENLIAVKSS